MAEEKEEKKKPKRPKKQATNKKKQSKETTFTDEVTAVLQEIKETPPAKEKTKGEVVTIDEKNNVYIGTREYVLVKNYREAFDAERLGKRYSEVLSKYDYIVADWGNEQLRLKGFFESSNRKATSEQKIDILEEYLYEYCNFGCAYFVLKRIGKPQHSPETREKRNYKAAQKTANNKKQVSTNKRDTEAVKQFIHTEKKDEGTSERRTKNKHDRSFTIRKREE